MNLRGSFTMIGFEKNSKYLWQYERREDSSGVYFYHVIRPLFQSKCGTRYWDLMTYSKTPNIELYLSNGEKINIDSITKYDTTIHITITWSQTSQLLWNSIKDSSLGKIMEGLEKSNINTDVLKDMDEELDNAVIFCQKLANGIQILQDKLGQEDNNTKELIDLFPKGNIVKKTVTYVGIFD
tara:strand:- start:7267 stop:7812 length:546 start_codon:yes stop_codon:yes gene_type:complete